MKIGLRKPSVKKMIKARTTARLKKTVKSKLIPFYNRKGIGWLHPNRKIYNYIYKRISFSIFDVWNFIKKLFKRK